MMERLNTDNRETVENEIQMSEEAHSAITKRHFGVNWRDPEQYDIVLSTARMSVDECAEELERVMAMPRFQPTAASQRLVADLALEWSIRAALRHDPRTADTPVRLECSDGFVRVAGSIASAREVEHVCEVVASVAAVRAVDNRIAHTVSTGTWMRAEA
jgi:osmotically-inducible protein OsmY